MFESSRDILFYVLAICTIIFTAFFCWFFYYIIAIVKNAYNMTKSVKEKIDMIDDILKTLKSKINSTASYVGVAVNSIEKIVDLVSHKKARVNKVHDEEGGNLKPKTRKKNK